MTGPIIVGLTVRQDNTLDSPLATAVVVRGFCLWIIFAVPLFLAGDSVDDM